MFSNRKTSLGIHELICFELEHIFEGRRTQLKGLAGMSRFVLHRKRGELSSEFLAFCHEPVRPYASV